jgi:hypothetical protein
VVYPRASCLGESDDKGIRLDLLNCRVRRQRRLTTLA